ncbi:MAG: LuxR family transcriptional regulator [Proteobacteria bacterium]|nr:LuxR family transcriptional regulator [Pseudomonadota bacterium]
MREWKEDQLQALIGESSQEELFAKITSFGREVGFEHCAYGVRVPLPISNPKIIMLNNYPLSWQQAYSEKGYLLADPAVRHGMSSISPYVWSGFDKKSDDIPFWEDANSHGIVSGWAQPVLAPNGIRGMFTVTRGADPITPEEIREQVPKMLWLSQVAHYGLSRHLIRRPNSAGLDDLTARELEVMRWIAEGKTSSEISMILSISERTVNFHTNCAMTKLEAPNRTAAVVRAVLLGLIT